MVSTVSVTIISVVWIRALTGMEVVVCSKVKINGVKKPKAATYAAYKLEVAAFE